MGGYLDSPPLVLAHRGGVALPANAGIEGSVRAIGNAVALGITYIEVDARASADGEAFAFHDPDLRRVVRSASDPTAQFATLTAEQIRSHPLDGGEQVATIAELLAAFPTIRFNIDVKTAEVIAPTVRAIEDAGAHDRVLLASFSHRRLMAARKLLPGVASSASPREIAALWLGRGPVRSLGRRHGAVCFQVPELYRDRRVVTPGFIAAAHARDQQVHVWTVDEPDDINRLLDAGVDGLITDRPDVVREVLEQRGQWR